MSIETKCFCDMCGAVRGATNHWFMVGSLPGAIVVKRWESSKFASAQIHLCGQKCVHALLDRWLTTGSLSPIQPASVPDAMGDSTERV